MTIDTIMYQFVVHEQKKTISSQCKYFLGLTFLVNNYNLPIEKERKSERWMPWLWEAKKDVVSCDKVREGANDL